MAERSVPELCRWLDLHEALERFVRAEHGTHGQRHIKPLHWYIACRLCLEGGFDPDQITPRPPFRVQAVGSGRRQRRILEAIRDWHDAHGYAPSIRDLMRMASISSTSVVDYSLGRLKEMGLVDRQRKIMRSIVLTDAGRREVAT